MSLQSLSADFGPEATAKALEALERGSDNFDEYFKKLTNNKRPLEQGSDDDDDEGEDDAEDDDDDDDEDDDDDDDGDGDTKNKARDGRKKAVAKAAQAVKAVERTTQPMFFVARPAGQGVAPRRALEYRDEEECPQVLVDMLNGPDGDLFQALEGNNMNTYCTLAGRQVPPSHSRWQGLSAPVRASLQPQPSHRTLPPLPRLDN